MVETKDVFVTNYLRKMVRKYAAKPERFFVNDQINEGELDKLIVKLISITSGRRAGKACIVGTRIAVCDIICDTSHLTASKGWILKELYGGGLPPEGIDAAYAFLMKNHDKVAKDYRDCYGHRIPQKLYT